jgi:urease accessory protein
MDEPTGWMRLRAERRGARTVLTEAGRTAPFHPSPALPDGDGGAAEVVVQEVGPGVFPDDRLLADVEVGAGATLTVRGQGATRIYPSRGGSGARSLVRLRVAAGACLRWLPGETIPFRDAILRQDTVAEVAAGGRLAVLELFVPGRLAMGERNAFTRLDLRLRIDLHGVPLLRERALLEPAVASPAAVPVHAGFGCSGLLAMVGFPTPGPLAPEPVDGVWLGGDGDDRLYLARALGPSPSVVRAALHTVLERAGACAAKDG